MSENFADFLNDNAGVVGAAAGYSVNRKLAEANRQLSAYNQNFSALRRDLRALQGKLAQSDAEGKRERLNREMLFQVSLQVKALQKGDHSVDLHLEALRVSSDFHQLGLTSATFDAIEDKAFFNDVATSIEEEQKRIWSMFTDEMKERLTDLLDWHYANELAEGIAITDETIDYAIDLRAFCVDKQQLENHISDLRTHRALCCEKVSSLKGVPEDTVVFITSESVRLHERLAYLPEIGKYVSALCLALDVDPKNLPTPVERHGEEHLCDLALITG